MKPQRAFIGIGPKARTFEVRTFIWSPEGRPLLIVEGGNKRQAWATFKSLFPQHAKYRGEVAVEVEVKTTHA